MVQDEAGVAQGVTYGIARTDWTGLHCGVVLQEHYMRFGCPDRAVRTWHDADGVSQSRCARHLSEGIALAARLGWVSEWSEVAAA